MLMHPSCILLVLTSSLQNTRSQPLPWDGHIPTWEAVSGMTALVKSALLMGGLGWGPSEPSHLSFKWPMLARSLAVGPERYAGHFPGNSR